jgi:3,4-dihydroxy 2-butanone 4-phosphate synthase / GTP cyclohydrolase II
VTTAKPQPGQAARPSHLTPIDHLAHNNGQDMPDSRPMAKTAIVSGANPALPGGTTPRTPRGMSDGETTVTNMQFSPGGATPRTPRGMSDGEARISNMQSSSGGATPRGTDEERSAAVPLDEVARAIKDIADGRPVVVVDDADRENEGDIVFAASKATPELLAFTIRYGRGLICVPMLGPDLDRLNVPQMTSQNQERHGTAFTVSVDAREEITTGISAADRARTIQLLASPASGPDDLVRPGHIFPLRYTEGGVLRRRGHTEAAVDLAVLAGLPPAGVVCEVIGDDGTMLRLPGLREFADEHGLALISVEQLIEHRRRTERLVTRVAETVIPNAYGDWRAYGYRSDIDGIEHLALVLGDIGADGESAETGEDVLTRVHSECLTGDVFGSQRCDCGAQLDSAMAKIAERGRGVVLYLRGHEGRGIGLLSKLQAYKLQDAGADTVDANLELGLPVDAREYSVAAQLLDDLGVRSVRLLTNNPAKVDALAAHGFGVTRIPLPTVSTPQNLRYLTTKRDRLGHQLETLAEDDLTPAANTLPRAEVC